MRHYLLVIPAICALVSCGTVQRNVYRANPINLPGLTQKGESRLTAGAGANVGLDNGDAIAGGNLQGAYAVSNHLTLMGAYTQRSGSKQGWNDPSEFGLVIFPVGITARQYPYDSAVLHYRNNTWELGTVYTRRFGRHVFFTIGAGGGAGAFNLKDGGELHDTGYNAYLNTRVTQWFIQPAMYFKWHRVELGTGFRISMTHYDRVATNYTPEQQYDFAVNDLQGTNMTMVQPFCLLRLTPGPSWLQLELQGNVNLGGNSSGPGFSYYYLNGDLGVSVRLGP